MQVLYRGTWTLILKSSRKKTDKKQGIVKSKIEVKIEIEEFLDSVPFFLADKITKNDKLNIACKVELAEKAWGREVGIVAYIYQIKPKVG